MRNSNNFVCISLLNSASISLNNLCLVGFIHVDSQFRIEKSDLVLNLKLYVEITKTLSLLNAFVIYLLRTLKYSYC